MLEGIEEIVADTFVFKCLQTLTGVKFLLATVNGSPPQIACKEILRGQTDLLHKVYEVYADFVGKNPF